MLAKHRLMPGTIHARGKGAASSATFNPETNGTATPAKLKPGTNKWVTTQVMLKPEASGADAHAMPT